MIFATDTGAIPPHLDKFLDVSLKHLEFCTTMSTLLLGAVAYVVTKHYLEKEKAHRPGRFWIFPPVLFSVATLVVTLRAYTKVEDSLLEDKPIDFAVWWQSYELWIFLTLIAGTISLSFLYAAVSRK